MNSRRCLSQTADPLLSVSWFQNHTALEFRDQRCGYAAVFSISV